MAPVTSGRDAGQLQFRFAGMIFHLEQVQHRPFAEVDAVPVALLEGGTEVAAFHRGELTYLLVDHRSHRSAHARVEFWRASTGGELAVAGLYALCDAVGEPGDAVGRRSKLRPRLAWRVSASNFGRGELEAHIHRRADSHEDGAAGQAEDVAQFEEERGREREKGVRVVVLDAVSEEQLGSPYRDGERDPDQQSPELVAPPPELPHEETSQRWGGHVARE